MDPSPNAPHQGRHTLAMSSGIIEPQIRFGSTSSPAEYQDQGPPEIGIQRFDTAKEDFVDMDGGVDFDPSPSTLPTRASPSFPSGPSASHRGPSTPSVSQSASSAHSEAPRTRPDRGYSASSYSIASKQSIPPPGSVLTGKQEHYLKRELISQQTQWEISELASPTALQRFGAPFKSDAGEVPPEDSELPLLRYIFVHFVRNFPFLDQAKEREFWQDKLQVVSRLKIWSCNERGRICSLTSVVSMLVFGKLRQQTHLELRRQIRRDKAEEIGRQGTETGRTDDGLGHTHRFWLRRAYTFLRDGSG